MTDNLTRDQEQAARLLPLANPDDGPLKICGYAGTGKSWLACNVAPEIFAGKRLVYAAPTNKVARKILRTGIRDAGYEVSDFPLARARVADGFTDPVSVGTVHSLLHLPKTELVCESTGKPCHEGGQCSTHRSEHMLVPVGLRTPPQPCRIQESDLLPNPRPDPLKGADVIIIDETSMLGYDDYQQLCAECVRHRIPLIMFGDPGQLPPILNPWEPQDFSALNQPAITMEEIRRQKLGDPIIGLSMMARTGQYLTPGWSPGPRAHILPFDLLGESALAWNSAIARNSSSGASSGDMIICARHDGHRPGGRVWHNMRAREALGFTSQWPVPGDVVAVYGTDYSFKQAWNSDRGIVQEAGEPFLYEGQAVIGITVKFSEYRNPRRFLALAKRFNYPANKIKDSKKIPPSLNLRPSFRKELEAARPDDLSWRERKMLVSGKEPLIHLDYGYALTVWKAQGDEAPGVLVTGAFDRLPHVDRSKYLYTAITRAREVVAIG